jgi:hypothetical protein
MQVSFEPLNIIEDVTLRYRPLPAFDGADYIEKHIGLLESSGAFESLMYGAASLRMDENTIDLAGLAAIGKAFSTVLTKSIGESKKLRALILSHCVDFNVEVEHEGAWVKLDTAAVIQSHLTLDQCVAVVYALGGGVLRPLWHRLRSFAGEKHSESATPSTETSPAS